MALHRNSDTGDGGVGGAPDDHAGGAGSPSDGPDRAEASPNDSTADEPPSTFRTKRGECRIGDDELVLESSFVGLFRRLYEGNRWIFAGYVLAVVSPVAVSLTAEPESVLLWVGGALAVVLVATAVNRARGFTSDGRIPLDAVESVSATGGSKGLTRPRFVVTYRKGGEEKRRYVLMPSKYLSYGDEAFERGKRAFRERGLLDES
ncbi:MAG: hypothetical protein ABEJ40_02095 [Haloarculaceae archaeon]